MPLRRSRSQGPPSHHDYAQCEKTRIDGYGRCFPCKSVQIQPSQTYYTQVIAFCYASDFERPINDMANTGSRIQTAFATSPTKRMRVSGERTSDASDGKKESVTLI